LALFRPIKSRAAPSSLRVRVVVELQVSPAADADQASRKPCFLHHLPDALRLCTRVTHCSCRPARGLSQTDAFAELGPQQSVARRVARLRSWWRWPTCRCRGRRISKVDKSCSSQCAPPRFEGAAVLSKWGPIRSLDNAFSVAFCDLSSAGAALSRRKEVCRRHSPIDCFASFGGQNLVATRPFVQMQVSEDLFSSSVGQRSIARLGRFRSRLSLVEPRLSVARGVGA
jgi:hypothetical protein